MAAETKIRAFKGFDANLQCRGFQFEVGKTYHADGEIILCGNGFHAIPEDQHPLSVFGYYPPARSRFCVVEVAGKTMREGDKIAAETLTVTREIGLSDLVAEAVKWVMDRSCQEGLTASGYQGAATASGYQGAATASGDWGAATASGDRGAATASGDRGAATASGDRGAATASGYQGAATASGDWGAATASGDRGAATASGGRGAATASGDLGAATASGYQGAATASGYQGAATASGYQGAATASGYQGAATASGDLGAATASGDWGAATASGESSCAMATGFYGRVRGEIDGVDLFARELVWDDEKYTRKSIACGTTGVGGIKAGVWYRCEGGKLVEA